MAAQQLGPGSLRNHAYWLAHAGRVSPSALQAYGEQVLRAVSFQCTSSEDRANWVCIAAGVPSF